MPREVTKVKKPANTAFKQQRLKAWQPILTPKTVLPTFFAVGAVFLPLGIGLFVASDQVKQISIDYTQCNSSAPATFAPPAFSIDGGAGLVSAWKYNNSTSTCSIQFNVSSDMVAPVFMYYRLTNFYQNHRRYVKSFDSSQLLGAQIVNSGSLNTNCEPLKDANQDPGYLTWTNPSNSLYQNISAVSGAQYYPCGLIANSLFSDNISLSLTPISSPSLTPYSFTQKGISWPADSNKYSQTPFANANGFTVNGVTYSPKNASQYLVPPPQWQAVFPQWQFGYNATNLPNLATWESFQVWMRTAGLPNFRKLYGRNDNTNLVAGTWQIDIFNSFQVIPYGGTKSIVISTISIIGGKNPFLGIAYMVVGCICLFLGVVFLIKHMVSPRKLGDHTYLSWNQAQAPGTRPGENNAGGPSAERPERTGLLN